MPETPEMTLTHPSDAPSGPRPADLRVVWLFFVALAILLAGYMFLGRGFAHLGMPPIYVGEVVLLIGLIATAIAWVRLRLRPRLSLVVWLLIGFMVLGLARTLPYVGMYGVDALRDAVLWGYVVFALIIYVLADRMVALGALRLYGWVVPVFALWLPIAFNIFLVLSASIGPDDRGSNVPLVFFKSGDMAVHIVGSIAFLVLGTSAVTSLRAFLWRAAIVVPLLWTALVAGATNRGGLVAVFVGLIAVAALTRRPRNWLPVVAAPAVLAVAFAVPTFLAALPQPTASPLASDSASSAAEPSPRQSGTASVDGVGNPGFESGEPHTASIAEWELVAGSATIIEGGFEGARSAMIQTPEGASGAAIRSDHFDVGGGDDVSVAVAVRAVAGNATLEVYIDWYGDSARLSSTLMDTLSTGGVTTWQAAGGVQKAPPDARRGQIRLRQAPGGTAIGVDDVILRSLPARSLVTNPGFELGAPADGTIGGWSVTSGAAAIVEGGGYLGGNFAAMQSVGGPYTSSIASSRFPIAAGEDLSVSLRIKAVDGRPSLVAFVNWYDSSGDQISTLPVSDLPTEGATTWRESTRIVTAPEETSTAEIVVWEAAGDSTLGIDEMIVRAGDFIVPPPMPEGRPATIEQIIENITSVFSDVEDEGLEGTKRFRLRWWGAIVNYTVFGEYFWTGKGFGINLADADGFQANEDRSLRAPHNSHITALARMGVPGFVLWVLLQGAFGIGLLRSVFRNRRAGDARLAAVGAWILAYWVAMMVNTSFDPYLEGPQGGIWFWSLFGLGMVVMRLTLNRREA
ncbi:MAG: hypothetical protein ABI841_00505 [Chloroflexota bacterium]